MNTTEFVNRFDVCRQKDDADALIQRCIRSTYIPFSQKSNVCKSIINATLKRDGRYVRKTALRMITFWLALIDTYTDVNIDYSNQSCIEDYDRLKKRGLVEMLINAIPESEVLEFNMIMDCEVDDLEFDEFAKGE